MCIEYKEKLREMIMYHCHIHQSSLSCCGFSVIITAIILNAALSSTHLSPSLLEKVRHNKHNYVWSLVKEIETGCFGSYSRTQKGSQFLCAINF